MKTSSLICRIYISLKEYDSARVYVERSLAIAKGYDIKYQLAKLYLISGDCHKEMANNPQNMREHIDNAKEMYEMARKVNEVLEINSLSKDITQKMNELDILCKANGIAL